MALSDGLGIGDLTIGINAPGMEDYKAALKLDLLTTSKEKINDVTAVETAINSGWQGQSRDKFLEDFKKTREKICTDLDAEYKDLENRLSDVQSAYFAIDQQLIQE